jgi:hypothetical protein
LGIWNTVHLLENQPIFFVSLTEKKKREKIEKHPGCFLDSVGSLAEEGIWDSLRLLENHLILVH